MAKPNGRGGWDLTDEDVAEIVAVNWGSSPVGEPEPHDCPRDCHPLRARDGVSPACGDDCQKPLGHDGRCDDPALAERARDAAWSGRLAAVYGGGIYRESFPGFDPSWIGES